MSVLSDTALKDIELARKIITEEDASVVVVNYGKIWKKKTDQGLKPFFNLIEEMGDELVDVIIGVNVLGKASSLLCRYAKVQGVYSPKGTKTAIALLIMGGIPCQIDRMIPHLENDEKKYGSYEKVVDGVIEPAEAYKLLKEKLLG